MSLMMICEMLLREGIEAYKKEGPKFMQRLVAKQKASRRRSFFVAGPRQPQRRSFESARCRLLPTLV